MQPNQTPDNSVVQRSDQQNSSLITASWILICLVCLISMIPFFGFASWLIAGPVLFITLVMGIIVLSRGGTVPGLFILLASLIAAPIFVVVAPIISSLLGISGAALSIGPSVEPPEPAHRSPQTTATSTAQSVPGRESPKNGIEPDLRDAPRTSTHQSSQNLPVPEQTRTFGGPLLWSLNAKAKLRDQFTKEDVANGICFFGCIPPASSVEATFTCYEASQKPYSAFLVDFATAGGKLHSDPLHTLAVSEHHKRAVARKLEGLSGPRRMQELIIDNTTGRTTEDGSALIEMYVQVEGNGAPNTIHMDRKEPTGTFQYLVEVRVNETSFIIPHQNWKWLWVVPIHQRSYQSQLANKPIPAAGISVEEAGSILEQTDLAQIAKSDPHFHSDLPWQTIVVEMNGERSVLDHALLLQPGDLINSRVKLSLNVPDVANVRSATKPAKIIVGIQ